MPLREGRRLKLITQSEKVHAAQCRFKSCPGLFLPGLPNWQRHCVRNLKIVLSLQSPETGNRLIDVADQYSIGREFESLLVHCFRYRFRKRTGSLLVFPPGEPVLRE